MLSLGAVDVLTRVNNSFLCGSTDSGTACPKCHPSCGSCTSEGICETCAAAGATKAADGSICLCNSGTGGTTTFHTICAACHPNCATCGMGNTKYVCHTCAKAGATLLTYNSVGDCQCRAGFVPEIDPTEACTPCAPAGCPNCIGSDESQCMSQEQADFSTTILIGLLNLPIRTESADNRICYRTRLPISSCTPDPIEAVTGEIVDYATVAKPTAYQCFDLLKAEWPFVNYWFDRLFPAFEGVSPNSHSNMVFTKTTLQIWIMQFGPSEMNDWTDIKEAMNDAGENWGNHMAWINSSPGFSLDAGETVKVFPEKLLTWLQSSCSSTTANCFELMTTFNMFSTACSSGSCSASVKTYCTQIQSDSPCAISA